MSPIRNLTDQGAMFPRIGTLRKGDKKPNDKQPGRDLDHFRFVSEDADVVARFEATYGKEPKSVRVFLPFQTTDENFPCYMEEWVAGGMRHRCDGVTCTVWQDEKGEYKHDPKPCPGGCKPVGRLSVVIPELGRLAFVTVLTSGINDVKNLTSELRALEMGIHDLRGIPLILSRVRGRVSTPEVYPKDHPKAGQKTGKRVTREKWLLHIEAAPSWVERQLAYQQAAALKLLGAGEPPLLESETEDDNNGIVVDAKTGEIVSTEEVPPGFADAEEPDAEEEGEDGFETVDEVQGWTQTKAANATTTATQPELLGMPALPADMSPKKLLDELAQSGARFESVVELYQAIKAQRGGAHFNWPAPGHAPGWAECFKEAMAARGK